MRPRTDFLRSMPLIFLIGVGVIGMSAIAIGDDATTRDEARPTADAEAEALFALKVRPLLAEKCFACHGDDPDDLKGGLDLTSREGMIDGGDIQGQAIDPGDAEGSPLYWAVSRSEPGLEMPPKEADALSQEQVWSIRDWINAGAPWPGDDRIEAIVASRAEGVTVETSGGLSEDWTNRRYDPEALWAFRTVRRPEVPEPIDGLHDANPIDRFLNDRLDLIGLEPAPRADRRTLIRRATFDLLGLPPTPEEIDTFLEDPRPDRAAFASVVDRLLASPHYGEKWGRHWLDVVRYADTAGFANDFERPNAWRYRDYVIRSFNDDKPYDEFIKEQIAGDEIDPKDPENLIASGFLRMGPWEQTGMSVAKVTRQQFLDDVTDLVGQVFLALPLQCARCHDHKFDPIPTRDYYRIQAVFATTQFADRDAPFLPEENTSGFDEAKYLKERITRYEAILKAINAREEAAARAWYAERGLEYAPRDELLKRNVPEDRIAPRGIGLEPADFGMERIARKNLTRHRWELDRYRPIAFSVYSGATRSFRNVSNRITMPDDPIKDGTIEQTAILATGNPFAPVEPVTPGVLSAAPIAEGSGGGSIELPDISESVTGRRLAFASWLVHPNHPMTARVMVNRIWQGHFGRGIVGTPNNFGKMGNRPTHPELLDWLASEFIARGWSIKAMHRLIMNSEAYARSSIHPDPDALLARDPKGQSLARFHPRRLSAEEIRDAMLAASGELNTEIGGIPINPDMNMEAALQPRMIMGTYAPAYQPSPIPEQRNRRTIYARIIRGQRDPFLEVFNQPGPDESCERRSTSTIAPQALSLFNGQEPYERALAMAHRLVRETDTRPDAVRLAFLLTTGREPSEADLRDGLEHWAAMIERHESLDFKPIAFPTEVTRRAVDENTGEAFSFTEELEVYRDYEPDLQASDLDAETRALADVCLVLFNSNAFLSID